MNTPIRTIQVCNCERCREFFTAYHALDDYLLASPDGTLESEVARGAVAASKARESLALLMGATVSLTLCRNVFVSSI